MSVVRWFLSFIVLFFDRVFVVKGVVRSPEAQSKINQETQGMKIYEFEACPFCVKVRRAMRRLSLNIERRDILKNLSFEEELLKGGGERQVPCLRIEEAGTVRWLYESDAIISYLNQKFQ